MSANLCKEIYQTSILSNIFCGDKCFIPYSGTPDKQSVFNSISIEQPTTNHYTRFQKFANKIQFKTREWAIRNELLFKQGERIIPIQFADTERNLWQRGTFKDLKIFINPVEGSGLSFACTQFVRVER